MATPRAPVSDRIPTPDDDDEVKEKEEDDEAAAAAADVLGANAMNPPASDTEVTSERAALYHNTSSRSCAILVHGNCSNVRALPLDVRSSASLNTCTRRTSSSANAPSAANALATSPTRSAYRN